MRRARIAGILLITMATSAALAGSGPLIGFGKESAAAQHQLEAQFDALLDAKHLREWMAQLSAHAHPVGSVHGKTNAHWMAEQFRSWGYDARIEVFHILFPTPKRRELELLAPTPFRAALVEPELDEDASSALQSEHLPGYNAYSVDGEVTAPLVYVNYGLPEDYETLERLGIDVRGKIVLARYGRSWRGIKPKVAAERGAVGCLIYSDPYDDGYYRGDAYPRGAFRNEHGVQRGSVMDMPLYPGDPVTPGAGSIKDAARIPLDRASTLTQIPVLPISHGDALPLLRALEGPVAPRDWRGALPLTYHTGPGPARVRLAVEFSWDTLPAYNVLATLRGSERPDQWIVRGNHHDAWVHGAHDPVSGLVALLEEARAVGELARSGHPPRRTVVYAAWDAEEPGLIGSVEWVEHHAATLRKRVAAYVNSDSNGRGFLHGGGSHTLERLFNEIARDVVDPQTGVNVGERLRARILVDGTEQVRRDLRKVDRLRLAALGSGSDYTPFLQHLGIASLNLGYGGENDGGEYHSIYDSFDHYRRFGDPEFAYGIALAQTAGRAVLRLANADRLPFEFNTFVETVNGYVGELEELLDGMRQDTEEHNRLVREGRFRLAADPTLTFVAPELEPAVPHLNLAPLRNALTQLDQAARHFAEATRELDGGKRELTPAQRESLDRGLHLAEQKLTREEGLPDRPWYRHHVYAPGFYTGYGVKTLPGVREAIEAQNWSRAEQQVLVAAEVLTGFAEHIDEIAAPLLPEGNEP